jgi:hypothetical protein
MNGDLNVLGAVTVEGALDAVGAVNFAGELGVVGAVNFGGELGVGGDVTIAGTMEVVGVSTQGTINAALVDANDGNFDTLVVNQSITGAATSINITSAAQSNSLTAVNNSITSSVLTTLTAPTTNIKSATGFGVVNVGQPSDVVFLAGLPVSFYFGQYPGIP